MFTDDISALASLTNACGDIQDFLRYWEASHPSDEMAMVHALLARIAQRVEAITGSTPGSLSNPRPADGTPKH
jgi:hypothetical protein